MSFAFGDTVKFLNFSTLENFAVIILKLDQRTSGPVNAHLISGPTVSTKTSKIHVGQGQPRVIIYINFVELESPMLHAKFQDIGLLVLEKIFKGFYYIWAWWPSWLCDLYHLY